MFLFAATALADLQLFPFKNGIRPLTTEQQAYLQDKVLQLKIIRPNKTAFVRSAAWAGLRGGLPYVVSNVKYLPKVGNQGAQGSCAAWSTCYYYKAYQESKEHGWGTSDYNVHPERVMSPALCYNLVNGGDDGGSMPSWIMQMIVEHGNGTWQDVPYNQAGYVTWPSQTAWTDALPLSGAKRCDCQYKH